jgi:hypothetical protein
MSLSLPRFPQPSLRFGIRAGAYQSGAVFTKGVKSRQNCFQKRSSIFAVMSATKKKIL